MTAAPAETVGQTSHAGVAIVGSGFAGLAVALELLKKGRRDFLVFEKADDVGGTWRDNTYPGCQCDVPSVLYSLSDHLNPDWSRTYSPQAEIQQYLQRVARKVPSELYRFGAEVTDAQWLDDRQHWRIRTTAGEFTADVLVTGHGGLSAPSTPDIAGLETFEGPAFHSSLWDDTVDLTGKRVAIVGTGASAIQIVPRIAKQVERLTVFQRTPPWVLPHRDRPTRRWERALYRRFPAVQRSVRAMVYLLREFVFLGMARRSRLTRVIEAMARKHLEQQVPDPQLRAKLTPNYTPGCKRLLPSNHYYRALSRDNVDLVTEKISEVRARSIVTVDGEEHEADVIVWATGFMVTNHPMLDVVKNADGQSLEAVWSANGMQAYLGSTVVGFPNLFLMTGPNTGLGHTSLLFMIEAQVDYVVSALQQMRERRIASVSPRPEVAERYNARLQRKMEPTVWTTGGCASWYLDAQGRNTTLWPDFTWKYWLRTRRFDIENYRIVGASARRPERVDVTDADAVAQ